MCHAHPKVYFMLFFNNKFGTSPLLIYKIIVEYFMNYYYSLQIIVVRKDNIFIKK